MANAVRRLMLAAALLATTSLAADGLGIGVAYADGGWLDDQAATWNRPGMALPNPVQHKPGPMSEADTRCAMQARPAETDEDRAVERAGWALYGPIISGWGVRIIQGTATYDGMCRPNEYQAFVFADGKLVGTLSPTPMAARTDGALGDIDFYAGDRIMGKYARYVEQDALCCPSAISTVTFRLDRSGASPTLTRESTFTEKTSVAPAP